MFNYQTSREVKSDIAFHAVSPSIIKETDHPISRWDISKEALKVLFRLRDAGYSGYLVGGGVRDLYLGKRPKDFDISTNARPGQLRKLFRNSRTIGRRFRLVQVFFRGGKIIEVSTLRSQSEYDIEDNIEVLPSNNTFGTLEEDSFRRDLTINSLFFEIENNTIIDYVGGVRDLDRGVIRFIGRPDIRVTRDPVRMMRAIRHAARNRFRIDSPTWKAIVENSHKLDLCPSSRIRDEVLKDLCSGSSKSWAKLAIECGMFTILFPSYGPIFKHKKGEEQKKQLLSYLDVIDRLQMSDSPITIPDYILFAVLLFPWACERFGIGKKRLTVSAYHHLSQSIRKELHEYIGKPFNLKRAVKEAISILLLNLSSFMYYSESGNIPKWLKKKSYYNDIYRFHSIIKEARTGEVTPESLFFEKKMTDQEVQARSPLASNDRSRNRRGEKPAFSSLKNGVFGLKKF